MMECESAKVFIDKATTSAGRTLPQPATHRAEARRSQQTPRARPLNIKLISSGDKSHAYAISSRASSRMLQALALRMAHSGVWPK